MHLASRARLTSAVGAVLALSLALSGCAGSDEDPSSGLTGDPIKIGFLNQGAGANAYPDFGAGGVAAAKQINDDGGIGGRPVDLVTCDTDGTPASSVKCANQFVSDKVVAVQQGIDVSSDSALPILEEAGIPFVGHAQFGVAQVNSPGAFFFGAASGTYQAVPLVTLKEKFDVTSVAYVVVDVPASRAIAAATLQPAAKSLGIDAKAVYYPASSPNFSATFASAAASKPDAVLIVASEPDCTALVAAGRSLGYKGKIFAGSCSSFIKADPVSAEGVLTDTDMYLPDDTEKTPDLAKKQTQTYVDAMKGQPAKNVNAFSQMSFSSTMDLASVIEKIDGEVTPAALTKALSSISGETSFMGQQITCDGKQWPNATSVCAKGLLVYEVKDGKRRLLSDGFVDASSYVS
jgi:branched-chain amino acid transport system substrate-binding protein